MLIGRMVPADIGMYGSSGGRLATFTAAANPTVVTLRFTVDVQNDPLAKTQSASADFAFEAQD